MLAVEPYKLKNRTRESGQAWDLIATHLNAIHAPRFRVSQKSVRDRAKILLRNFKLKIREEERASGIEVPELSELDAALEEIAEKEKAAQVELDLIEESGKRSELQDKANAEEMRFQAMEKLGQSKKRKEATGETASGHKKKARRSCSDTLDFMREKLENDTKIKQEELTQRRSEQQKIVDQQNNILQQMQLQQVNQRQQMQDMLAAIMQQSQQQNQTMLAIVEKFAKK